MNITNQNLKMMQKILSTLGDNTRLKILYSLFEKEKCVSEIYLEINESQSLVSHQLKVLKENKIVKTRKEGTKNFYSLYDEHVKTLLSVVEEHVEERIDD